MAQVEKGIEENQTPGLGGNARILNFHRKALQNQNFVCAVPILLSLAPAFVRSSVYGDPSRRSAPAPETSVDIETAPGPPTRGSNVTTTEIGGNTAGGSSFQEKAQATIEDLFLIVAMGVLASAMQNFSFTYLPNQFLFHSVIICATTVSMIFSVLVVFDILRGVPATSLKPSIYAALLCLFTSFIVYITALSFHHFFLMFSVYVLVALSVFVHFSLFKIVQGLNSPSPYE